MGLTLRPQLAERGRADGTRQVRIRLTKDRKIVYIDATFTLHPKHWNEKGAATGKWVRTSEPDHERLNHRLDVLLRDGRATALAAPLLGAAQMRDLLLKSEGRPKVQKAAPADPTAPPTDLVAFADYYVRQRAKTDKPNTVKFYREAAAQLAQWRGGLPLPFAELREQHLTDFRAWMLAKPRVFAGTANDRLVKLSTILRRAEKLGLLDAKNNPFRDFSIEKVGNKRPPRRPTEDERRAVLGCDLRGISGLRRQPGFHAHLLIRRDVWEMQYLIRGSRCGDMLLLREQSVRPDRISFAETKTGKLKNVARTEAINAILRRYPPTGDPLAYVFPLLDHRQPYAAEFPTQQQLEARSLQLRVAVKALNRGLGIIAAHAGVPAFSSHSARHMYTERAFSKTKDMRLVQKMLNHADISTTERYLQALGYDALDAATELVLADD